MRTGEKGLRMGQRKEETCSDRWSLRLNSCSASFACPGCFFLIAVWVLVALGIGWKSSSACDKSLNYWKIVCVTAGEVLM